ncbi:hypothetical protein Tco_0425347 [Tanacetum coccineum]
MTSLADKSLLSGGDNKPPMLEKHLYDSWKSRMELYMMNRPHGELYLHLVEKGPLVWPSITEDGVTRLKEYVELTPAEAIQADCDIKAINIILQGLPTEIYALVSHIRVQKILGRSIKTVDARNIINQTKPQASGQALTEEEIAFLADPGLPDVQNSQTVITHNAAYQADDLDAYDSDCDELNSPNSLMANLSRNGLDALTESRSETDIISDSNIIPYSQVSD